MSRRAMHRREAACVKRDEGEEDDGEFFHAKSSSGLRQSSHAFFICFALVAYWRSLRVLSQLMAVLAQLALSLTAVAVIGA